MDRRAVFFLTLLALSASEPIKLNHYPHNEDKNDTLIWYNTSLYHAWSHQLDNLIEVYSNPVHTEGRKENLMNCSYTKPPVNGKVCNVPTQHFKPCTVNNHFGYKKGSPCIFLELETDENWKPKFFNSSKSLPKNMPQALKSYVQSAMQVNRKMWQTVWVNCEGETPSDIEFIGPVSYLPQQGIPGYLLSGAGNKGYLPPIIAVHLEAPVHGVVINIECKAWVPSARNESKVAVASTKFQFLIDDN
ncbi:Sodium potassium-transporting ATPase subunit [Nesidiocoris tenuis]|nr:Sodium potassium-transporting ATPase subunit [Nesidiocoris tenuis]